ncbi:hypothetical protein [Paeniglutamicibacter sp.]|uniref:hypothetical protein n=1 Tax=Paeniglutamicibacter sp. TaxID=1934391 RepID=UPI0039895085
MSKETIANPVPEAGGKAEESPAATRPGKRSPEELPDGSGNDSQKRPAPGDEGRFDAG